MNARQPSTKTASPSAQFSVFLSRFPAEIVTLAKRCMTKLRRALPGANEIVYDYRNSVVVSFSMSERGYEAIVAIAISGREVKLYFDKSLPDPNGLLEGTGTKVRSVAVKSASELDGEANGGDIHGLIKAAIERSGVSFPRRGSTRMIIKSPSRRKGTKKPVSKKPRPKRVAKGAINS